jgi:hypothetical protein
MRRPERHQCHLSIYYWSLTGKVIMRLVETGAPAWDRVKLAKDCPREWRQRFRDSLR